MGRERGVLVVLTVLSVVFMLFVYATLTDSPLTAAFARASDRASLASDGLRRRGGYVLVRRYSGQQGAGVRALSSLQQWIRDLRLPMMIVEPFVQNSVLGIRPRREKDGASVRFGEMFDLENFNAVSRSEGLPEVTSWSSFRTNTHGQAVWINMVPIKRYRSFPSPVVDNSSEQCRLTTISGPDQTSVSLCQVRNATGYWKFATTHSLSAEEVYGAILRGLDPSNVTLIFSLWRGPWKVEKKAPSSSLQLKSTNSISSHQDEHKFKDSKNLKDSALAYQSKFLAASKVGGESRYVAVMIRAEHSVLQFLAQRTRNTSEDLEKCMEQLVKETETAMEAVGASGLLVTSDVGYYGSGSWTDTVSSPEKGDVANLERRVQSVVERLYQGRQGWTFDQWERTFVEASGGVGERGYVAALQRALATDRRAACLVLLGGGRFQELSLEQYLSHTSNQTHSRCIHMVCMQRKYRVSFSSMLKKAGVKSL